MSVLAPLASGAEFGACALLRQNEQFADPNAAHRQRREDLPHTSDSKNNTPKKTGIVMGQCVHSLGYQPLKIRPYGSGHHLGAQAPHMTPHPLPTQAVKLSSLTSSAAPLWTSRPSLHDRGLRPGSANQFPHRARCTLALRLSAPKAVSAPSQTRLGPRFL